MHFYCEGDGVLAQVAQRGYEVSTLGDTQKLCGQHLGKLVLGGPA